jgi:hypothetical protein
MVFYVSSATSEPVHTSEFYKRHPRTRLKEELYATYPLGAISFLRSLPQEKRVPANVSCSGCSEVIPPNPVDWPWSHQEVNGIRSARPLSPPLQAYS